MPIYEYKCQNCGHSFEQLQKITDKPLRNCPKCKKLKLAKLISNTSFQLKGNGWYATDFKDKKPKKEAKKDKKTNNDNVKEVKTTAKTKEKSKDSRDI